MIDQSILAWAVPGSVEETVKDIDPNNDDQRKAAFARMAEDDGSEYNGKLEKGKSTIRQYNTTTHSFSDRAEVEATGIGDYIFHKAANGENNYTVTHKPTGAAILSRMSKSRAEKLVRKLHGGKVKIPTKSNGEYLEPDTSHPGFAKVREKVISIASRIDDK